jgi:hypothetical protein
MEYPCSTVRDSAQLLKESPENWDEILAVKEIVPLLRSCLYPLEFHSCPLFRLCTLKLQAASLNRSSEPGMGVDSYHHLAQWKPLLPIA